MESSFKPAYDKTVNPDGSIELSFKSRRLSPQAAAGAGMMAVFVMFPVACAATLPVAGMFVDRGKSLSDVSLLLWNVLAFIVYFGLLWWLVHTRTKLLIKPGEGLIFSGKSLPYRETQNVGIIVYPNARHAHSEAFVYADTHGSQVQLTKYIPSALAESVAKEIKLHSGTAWASGINA